MTTSLEEASENGIDNQDAEKPEEEETAAFFVEAEEVLSLIASFSDPSAAHAAAAERVALVLDRYQEQPTVLDPQLEAMVVPLLEAVRGVARDGAPRDLLPHTCRVMYTLCKVRGYKTVVKFVPHEVADLEPLVALLMSLDTADYASWQIAYSLMVWLSMVVMVPFDLAIIDSGPATAAEADAAGGAAAPPSLVGKILQAGRLYLASTGPAREAAAVLCARLLTRPGLQPRLREFVQWGVRELVAARQAGEGEGRDPKASFLTAGIYAALACAMKLGHRVELLPQLPHLATVTNEPKALLEDPSVTRRKLGMKLLQRAALVYLPPTVAAWRYQRGARSLEHNLAGASGAPPASGGAAAAGAAAPVEAEGAAAEEEELVPQEIEALLEQLLSGLKDSDTVVRWSAAKGVGRVTARLPLELADDVVGSALELLSDDEEANAWHGGCLALAELARRGLLLPTRLAEVVPLLCAALAYDVERGASSVGTHVRDAACYVCWAFARAFEPAVMAPHVGALAPGLLVQVAFDREVNCRRAAAAAFQENVGRQGSFPHGIDIVTRADYYAVGSRSNAYLSVSPYLAGFDEYRRPLLLHLLEVKARHWEPKLRLLAAQAAARLAPLDPEWVTEHMLPTLAGRCISSDLKERHGATHMLAETLAGLVHGVHGGDGGQLPPELRKTVGNVVPNIEKMRLYRGRGGEVMRGAACRLLEVLALLKMPCGPKAALEKLKTIDECLKHPTESISHAAVAALRAVTAAYFPTPPKEQSAPDDRPGSGDRFGGPIRLGCDWGAVGVLVPRYSLPLGADPNPGLRRGFALALGALPRAQLAARPSEAVHALCVAARYYHHQPAEVKDPETRRNAVRGLLSLAACLRLRAHGGELSAALWVEAIEAMLRAFEDYQTDNRGDVGSWVREAAMQSALPLLALGVPPPGAENAAVAKAAAAVVEAAAEEGAEKAEETAEEKAAAEAELAAEREAERAAVEAALPALCARLVRALCQQLNEKIDRVREAAGVALRAFLATAGLGCPHHAALCAQFKVEPGDIASGRPQVVAQGVAADVREVDFFVAPTRCFPVSVGPLALPAYRRDVLRGLAVSAGGITSTTSKPAGSALEKLCATLGAEELRGVGDDLLALLAAHATEERLGLPLLRMAQLLIEAKRLDPLLLAPATPAAEGGASGGAAEPFGVQLLERMRGVTRGSKDVPTLIVGLSLQVLLLPYATGPLLSDLLRSSVLLLAHKYPKVRKAAADQLYLHLLTFGDPGPLCAPPAAVPPPSAVAEACGLVEVAPEPESAAEPAPEPEPAPVDPGRLDVLMSLLLETPWLGNVEQHARPARATMLDQLGLPPPLVAAAAPQTKVKKSDEGTYAELVGEMGY